MFKVGDRLVLIKNEYMAANIGSSGTLYHNEEADYFEKLVIKWDRNHLVNDQSDGRYSWDKFILEEIYNSPLYQALKEEE